ncbi:hypothetical protein EUGRSUZ_E00977 [Eucalyptus grandis]|uniref:Uncharacterized protein n=1 Tax=Eucalyptus grandis TaxID=71139 RepID=A0ACC3KQC1_EUCGR|nr:hypothetical protein EUGRSUZ_E00977 [Eucalyptus grandis]
MLMMETIKALINKLLGCISSINVTSNYVGRWDFQLVSPKKPEICRETWLKIIIPYCKLTDEICELVGLFHLSLPPNDQELSYSNMQILNISFENHEITVKLFVARDCYNSSGESLYNNDPSLILPDFPISSAKNKFIVVGCDTYATFSGSTYVTGCLSSCGNILDVINGSCSGIGCCETSIPRDTYRYNISVETASLASPRTICTSRYNNHVDWLIPDQTCDDAKKNTTTYMCQENSNCTDAENGNGYQCRCLEGFQGNPYLQNGCQGTFSGLFIRPSE